MRLKEIGHTIGAYAEGLRQAGASTAAHSLRELANLLTEFSSLSILVFLEKVRNLSCERSPGSVEHDTSTVGEISEQLRSLRSVLKFGRATSAQLGYLDKLIALLDREDESLQFAIMLEALRRALIQKKLPPEDLVVEFVRRLKSDLGTEAFENSFAELAASSLKQAHMVAVARGVYGGIPAKTSRKAALGYIRKPHDAYVSAKRGIDAMGGRSAA